MIWRGYLRRKKKLKDITKCKISLRNLKIWSRTIKNVNKVMSKICVINFKTLIYNIWVWDFWRTSRFHRMGLRAYLSTRRDCREKSSHSLALVVHQPLILDLGDCTLWIETNSTCNFKNILLWGTPGVIERRQTFEISLFLSHKRLKKQNLKPHFQ